MKKVMDPDPAGKKNRRIQILIPDFKSFNYFSQLSSKRVKINADLLLTQEEIFKKTIYMCEHISPLGQLSNAFWPLPFYGRVYGVYVGPCHFLRHSGTHFRHTAAGQH